MRNKLFLLILVTFLLLLTLHLLDPQRLESIVYISPTGDISDIPVAAAATQHQRCEKRKNFVFVKTHKTGTSTTVNILYNFGINNGLNYAVYPYQHQLYWIKTGRLMKLAPNETYNIMCQHMVFNKSIVEKVMPPDAFYFSLLREPVKAFISFFIFYGKDKRAQDVAKKTLTLDESINQFLNGFMRRADKFEVTNSLNSMSFDLGMSNGQGQTISRSQAAAYVEMLDKRFDLIMTLEQLDESLTLLKEDMCWNTTDLYYLNRMQSRSNRSHEALSEATLDRLKHYLTPDYILYNHFKEKLMTRIAAQPPSFQQELAEFKAARSQFEAKCLDMSVFVNAVYGSRAHPLTDHGKESRHCVVLEERDTILTKLVSLLQDSDMKSRDNHRVGEKYKKLGEFPRKWKLTY